MDLISEGKVSVDEGLTRFPIVDTVFSYLMRTLLILNNKAQSFDEFIGRSETFAYLSSIFDIQMELFENCIKFLEADIFAYEEDPREVYMAYIMMMENISEEDNGEPGGSSQEIRNHKKNEMYYSSNSVYEFVDFTEFGKADKAEKDEVRNS